MCGTTFPRVSEQVNHPLIPGITDTRLDTFYAGPYASQHLDRHLELARYAGAPHLKFTAWSAPGKSKPGFEEAFAALGKDGREIEVGHKFGPSWTNHWVQVDMKFPKELQAAKQEVYLEFDPSAEALVFTLDGAPIHGMTGGVTTTRDGQPGNQSDRRVDHIVPPAALAKGEYSIVIEVSCNGMFGVPLGGYRYQVPEEDKMFPLVSAALVLPNIPIRELKFDFSLLTQIARSPQAFSVALQQRALKAANDIMSAFKVGTDGRVADEVVRRCRDLAAAVIGDLSPEGMKKLATRSTDKREGKVWAIGHCHIDTAWLWRYTQTQQKVARSWSTQCDLMDQWPNHQFAASSAQQYLWLETLYPDAFKRVKHYISEGRFHAVGGAWLEHDCMIPSGESLIRQYLYGQRYFKSRFGAYCREAWLPDTFGYASQLPQILRGVGMKYFFTQKLSWNNINKFPYSTFNWVALDGSVCVAHMTPVDSYNSQCDYEELVKGSTLHKNLAVTDDYLLLFGNGDGGGGPTGPMLEKLDRLSALSMKNPEVPDVKMGSPIEFFENLMETTEQGTKLPTWRGELYFEYHRGTYTSQSKVKEGNKLMETLLREVEYFATLASVVDASFEYPQKALDEIWQDTLLNQFHDCLPGTTIGAVVDDILEIYSKRSAEARLLLEGAKKTLFGSTGASALRPPSILSDALGAVDPLGLARSELYRWPTGEYSWLQTSGAGLGSLTVPPSSLAGGARAYEEAGSHRLENDHFRLSITDGRIDELWDKRVGRSLIIPGPGAETGGLVVYEDYPLRYDAWDAEVYHLDNYETVRFDEVECREDGPRASLVARAKFGKSSATLTFSLDVFDPSDKVSSRGSIIRVQADIDWHEHHKFLKFVLPVDVHAPSASYGTQFGICPRPTHRNTTHDQAKFECCAHGFVDLSEAAYGVALMSRDKYGYSVEGNTMRLSLLRGPTTPDPRADGGRHIVEWGVMPHIGGMVEAHVPRRALEFNNQVHVMPALAKGHSIPTFELQRELGQAVVLETVKRGADDATTGEKTVILRLYESVGGRTRDCLRISGLDVKSATWADMLERPLEEEPVEPCVAGWREGALEVQVHMRCHEIKTLRLVLA